MSSTHLLETINAITDGIGNLSHEARSEDFARFLSALTATISEYLTLEHQAAPSKADALAAEAVMNACRRDGIEAEAIKALQKVINRTA